MNSLVTMAGNEVFTDSFIIAEGTGNQHKSVKRIIEKNKDDISDFGTLAILNRQSSGGRPEQVYLLSEEQAAFLMTLLRNTKQVVAFKKELVRQFYAMRWLIMERQTSEWQETRRLGKLSRKAETDTLKQLVEYAAQQGSEHPDKLYLVYSKLANKMIGISKRDTATVSQLNNLSLAENIILHCVEAGMAAGKHYKEIYQDSKARLNMFKDIAFLEG